MAIDSLDKLIDGLANKAQVFPINKASVTATTGNRTSMWRATGLPAQGAIPTAAAVCNSALLGALNFNAPTGGERTYVGRGSLVASSTALDVYLVDRLAHMGGLSGTVTTAQTVNVDCTLTSDNLVDRIGQADYTEIDWWLEWYTATGATAATATVTYTNQAGTAGRTTTVALAATRPAGNMLPIMPSGGDTGIRSVQSVQLSASTATAGNFGVTATRAITGISLGLANSSTVYDYLQLGVARVRDSACPMLATLPSTTSTGTLQGNFKLIQG